MKIRRKPEYGIISAQAEYEVIDEGEVWYVALDRSQPVVLRKEFYEPIPEATWRDVTARCAVHRDSLMCDDDLSNPEAGDHVIADILTGYRFRKVDGNMYCLGGFKPAFIIEKKDPV